MPQDDEFLNAAQTAVELNRTVSSVHRYVEVGRLTPAFEAPGLRGAKFFRRSDVEALAAELEAAA